MEPTQGICCDCLGSCHESSVFDPYAFTCDALLSPVCRWSSFKPIRPEMPALHFSPIPLWIWFLQVRFDWLHLSLIFERFFNDESIIHVSGPMFWLDLRQCEFFNWIGSGEESNSIISYKNMNSTKQWNHKQFMDCWDCASHLTVTRMKKSKEYWWTHSYPDFTMKQRNASLEKYRAAKDPNKT